jgi:hypothetical protein
VDVTAALRPASGLALVLVVLQLTACTSSERAPVPASRVELSTGGALGPRPVTYTAKLPSALRDSLGAPGGRPALLYLEGIRPGAGADMVRVFVDLPAATAATPVSDAHFVGYLSAEQSATAGEGSMYGCVLELSGGLRGIAAGAGELAVTLVPVAGQVEPATFSLTHQAIYVALAPE